MIQELQCMGVQLRVMTDKNVDKLNMLSISDNIINLTKRMDVYTELKKHKDNIHNYISEYTKHIK